ncbi:PAS domain S-box protein [Paracoccus aerius]|uniref:histidine kinase n=1 Tax=Paracoccus aerius TaxID=1915382 RepID=A0ABS1S810_9RHOB|nr:PAS domain S-box protein [Paracoccus aerius]MBL3674870.1 PAS domain S-box protein [Paracoccus aerius]
MTSKQDSMLLRRQRVLADIGEFALQSEDLDEFLAEACRLVADVMETRRAKVLEVEKAGNTLLVRAGFGWGPDIVGRTRIALGKHSSESFSLSERTPVIRTDVSQDKRFELPAFMKEAGIRAFAHVPIFLPGGRVYGLLQIDASEPRDFEGDEVEFLRTFATILGPVVDRILNLSELRSSREQFRLTVEAASNYAIFITDRDNCITDWLPGAAQIFGWSAAEAIGKSASMLFTSEDREAGVDVREIEEARDKGFAPDVRWHLRKDGSRVFIDGSVRALRDAEGRVTGYLKIGQDVTQSREAEARLQESDARLAALFSSAPVGLSEVDLNGGFLRANTELCRILDRSQDEVLAATVQEVTHPEDVARSFEAMAKAIATRQPVFLDKRYRRPDGAVVWGSSSLTVLCDLDGAPQSLLGVTADLTERRKMERALHDSEERLRNVLNAMNEGFVHLGPDFTILDVNRETLRLVGRNRRELVGRSHWEVFPETQQDPVGELLRQVMGERKPSSLEHRHAGFRGKALWLDLRVYPTPDGGVAIFWRDITKRKEVDDALRDSERRYRGLFESMDQAYAVVEVLKGPDGTWSDFRFIEVNPAFMRHTSVPYPVGKTSTELLSTPNPRWTQLYGQALDTGEPLRVEETEETLERVFDLNIFSLDRQRNRVAVLFSDITEWRQSATLQEMLIGELHHRTRNLMTVILSLCDMTANSSTDLKHFKARFQSRLEALARVQGLLSRLSDLDRVTFDELIQTELAAMGGRGDYITLNGPTGIRLRSTTVQTLAMGLHELATNAVKYGALGGPNGRLSISWSLEPEGPGGRPWLHIDWRESGVDMTSAGTPSLKAGQGRELIEQALPYQLRAKTTYTFTPDGVHCTISLPVSATKKENSELD